MLERTDFEKKLMIFFFPADGDKMSFRNDNMVIKSKEGKIKSQITCYRIFIVFVVGDTSITTGLLNRAERYGFSLCLMNRNLKMTHFIGSRMQGNTLLRKRQYSYNGERLAQYIIMNKISNQRRALNLIRNKTPLIKEGIELLDAYKKRLQESEFSNESLLGIEGSASRVYFSRIFDISNWKGRKPRIKHDYINASLDIGYTILFNILDALLNVYGFDEYYGVLHTCFYMRKSLVCDIIEPFRPIIDYETRKAINLGQIKESDFKVFDGRYVLEWSKSASYSELYLKAILAHRNELFMYVQSYYRAFMKNKDVNEFPVFEYQ